MDNGSRCFHFALLGMTRTIMTARYILDVGFSILSTTSPDNLGQILTQNGMQWHAEICQHHLFLTGKSQRISQHEKRQPGGPGASSSLLRLRSQWSPRQELPDLFTRSK